MIDWFVGRLAGVCEHDARSRLGKLGLTGEASVTALSKLTGWQRVRVSFTATG